MRQGSQSRAESMHLHQSTYLDSDWLEKSDLFLVTSKQIQIDPASPQWECFCYPYHLISRELFSFFTNNRYLHVCLKVCVGLFHTCWRWLWQLKLVVVILRKSTAESISWVVLSCVCNDVLFCLVATVTSSPSLHTDLSVLSLRSPLVHQPSRFHNPSLIFPLMSHCCMKLQIIHTQYLFFFFIHSGFSIISREK